MPREFRRGEPTIRSEIRSHRDVQRSLQDVASPVLSSGDFVKKREVPQARRYDLRHQTHGVEHALTTYTWLDPLVVQYHEHFPDGAVESLRLGSMVHSYTREHPELYTDDAGHEGEKTNIIVAAAITHDVGKTKVPQDILHSKVVYTPEERIEKLSKHVGEGFLLVSGAESLDELDLDVIDPARLKSALILAGHHFDQDDRGSYPPKDTHWLQTEDEFVHANRRVLIVGDRVDAFRTERSYKKKFSEQETKESLARQGFEGEIVDFMLDEHARQMSLEF